MKIIAGALKGRALKRPDAAKVRPMTDKERAALFDILGDIEGLTFLDAYAGSGAIGLEALSRGAARVEGVELSHGAARVVEANIRALGVEDSYRLHTKSVEQWHTANSDKVFDLIVAAPPFAELNLSSLSYLGTHLAPTGVMVVSYSSRLPVPELAGLELVDNRKYGDGSMAFYKGVNDEGPALRGPV